MQIRSCRQTASETPGGLVSLRWIMRLLNVCCSGGLEGVGSERVARRFDQTIPTFRYGIREGSGMCAYSFAVAEQVQEKSTASPRLRDTIPRKYWSRSCSTSVCRWLALPVNLGPRIRSALKSSQAFTCRPSCASLLLSLSVPLAQAGLVCLAVQRSG
jgi:hypothetical protein